MCMHNSAVKRAISDIATFAPVWQLILTVCRVSGLGICTTLPSASSHPSPYGFPPCFPDYSIYCSQLQLNEILGQKYPQLSPTIATVWRALKIHPHGPSLHTDVLHLLGKPFHLFSIVPPTKSGKVENSRDPPLAFGRYYHPANFRAPHQIC